MTGAGRNVNSQPSRQPELLLAPSTSQHAPHHAPGPTGATTLTHCCVSKHHNRAAPSPADASASTKSRTGPMFARLSSTLSW